MSRVVFQAEQVTKVFPGTLALDHVDFTAYAGAVNILVGENGAGKSTLLKVLAGVFPPDSGEIRLDGERIRSFNPGTAGRLGIAIIYQEFSLIPALTVAENIYIGREPEQRFGRLDRARMREAARTVLARLGLPVDPD
ncbi:MAG: ATP-binding cassette domain-containing protein, partial [Bradyrhizobium sp.]